MGGNFDWARVKEADMRSLSEEMFRAAKVPPTMQEEYWEWFELMKAALTR